MVKKNNFKKNSSGACLRVLDQKSWRQAPLLSLLCIIVLIVVFASLFASASPDGFEFVANKLGFLRTTREDKGFFAEYSLLTGLLGIALCLFFGFLVNKLLATRIK